MIRVYLFHSTKGSKEAGSGWLVYYCSARHSSPRLFHPSSPSLDLALVRGLPGKLKPPQVFPTEGLSHRGNGCAGDRGAESPTDDAELFHSNLEAVPKSRLEAQREQVMLPEPRDHLAGNAMAKDAQTLAKRLLGKKEGKAAEHPGFSFPPTLLPQHLHE